MKETVPQSQKFWQASESIDNNVNKYYIIVLKKYNKKLENI